MTTTLWTIGHSTLSIDEFIGLLQPHEIQKVADVRRNPMSRRHPHFNQVTLAETLKRVNIELVDYSALGGRRDPRPDSHNTAWKDAAFRGYADYMETEPFETAIERLWQEGSTSNIAVLCAEAKWWQCHRALIADYFKARGADVQHIMTPGRAQQHPYTAAASIVKGKLSYAPKAA